MVCLYDEPLKFKQHQSKKPTWQRNHRKQLYFIVSTRIFFSFTFIFGIGVQSIQYIKCRKRARRTTASWSAFSSTITPKMVSNYLRSAEIYCESSFCTAPYTPNRISFSEARWIRWNLPRFRMNRNQFSLYLLLCRTHEHTALPMIQRKVQWPRRYRECNK